MFCSTAYAFFSHTPEIACRTEDDHSKVQWRERTDAIEKTTFLLPSILLEAVDRELELLNTHKTIENDATRVVSVFKNVPPAADGTLHTDSTLNGAKVLWEAGLVPTLQ